MTSYDECELHRLTKVLESVDNKMGDDSAAHEALQKAAIALSVSFIHGLRPEVESQFQKLGQPLTDSERVRLRNLGIEPD